MKAKRYVSVLLAAAMLFVMGSCVSDDAPDFHEVRTGAAPAAAEPAVSAAEPDGVQTAAAVQTVLGYAAEEIPSPDWVLDFGVCDIYNETFYIAAAAADGVRLSQASTHGQSNLSGMTLTSVRCTTRT